MKRYDTMSRDTVGTEDRDLVEIKESSLPIYDGIILHVFRDTVRLPDGGTAPREVIRHNGAACVIPIDAEGNVLMVRQCRYAIGAVTLEIPAGKLDRKGEDMLACAMRELREETGAEAKEWLDLGTFYGAAAYADERIGMFAAKDLTFTEQKLDDDEFLRCERIPLATLSEMVLRGEIADGKTQVAVLKLAELRRRGQF